MNENDYIEEEVSLKDVISKAKDFWDELWRYWWIFICFCLPLLLLFVYNTLTTLEEYEASIVFMINEDNGGGGGLASFAGQLGLNLGGGGGEYNKEKVISLSRTDMIIHPVILDSIVVEGKKDLVGNHIIRIYGLHEAWKKHPDEDLRTFLFEVDTISRLSITGNRALKTCHSYIIGSKTREAISRCSFDSDSGILNINTKSLSEELSSELTNKIFEHLSSFYIKQQTEPQVKTYETLKEKADSINTLITTKEYELASLMDGNNSIFLRKFKLREARLQRELPAYASQYATLLQNLENANFMLQSKTPFFQVIDYPMYPLKVVKPSLIKAIVLGGGLGAVLSILFICGRKILRDAMEE